MRVTNPAMFQMARKLKGLTQTQLAQKAGLAQPTVSKLEAIGDTPKESVVERVAHVLGMPPAFFEIPGRYFPPATPLQRGKTGLRKKIKDHIEARANLVRLHLEMLSDRIEIDDRIPRLDPAEYGTPAQMAQTVRRYLRLPAGPIENMTDVLENNGVLVYLFDFGTNDLDAFTVVGTGIHPAVFGNTRFPGERLRLSLAHELGHIVMHSVPAPAMEMETQAWDFAGEFCAPKDDVYSELENLTSLRAYVHLKPKWRISAQALVTRASRLGAITANQARYLWMQINKQGLRRQEPLEMPVEAPTLLREVLMVMQEKLGYSEKDLQKQLLVGEAVFDELYGDILRGNDRPRLRLVRD